MKSPSLCEPFVGSFLPLLQVADGIEETYFKNLEDLIRHYKQRDQGLAMHLRHAVQRKIAILKPRVNEEECVFDGKTQTRVFSTSNLLCVLKCLCFSR